MQKSFLNSLQRKLTVKDVDELYRRIRLAPSLSAKYVLLRAGITGLLLNKRSTASDGAKNLWVNVPKFLSDASNVVQSQVWSLFAAVGGTDLDELQLTLKTAANVLPVISSFKKIVKQVSSSTDHTSACLELLHGFSAIAQLDTGAVDSQIISDVMYALKELNFPYVAEAFKHFPGLLEFANEIQHFIQFSFPNKVLHSLHDTQITKPNLLPYPHDECHGMSEWLVRKQKEFKFVDMAKTDELKSYGLLE